MVRDRVGLDGLAGHKWFSKAFHGDDSPIHWPKINAAETNGRISLFTGTYIAYRNKRAHHEQTYDLEKAVREFLLLNELYVLESSAVIRDTVS
ncbi:MAG: hypothetical protein HRT92_03645 [Piscirickettsiaceae bacterium]|nr:hypothetical protein [Piscirickettsiaceae bacterium]